MQKKNKKNKKYLWWKVLVTWGTSDKGSYNQSTYGIFISEGTCDEGYKKNVLTRCTQMLCSWKLVEKNVFLCNHIVYRNANNKTFLTPHYYLI